MADKTTLPRIRAADSITGPDGRAVNAFVRFWDTVCRQVEGVLRSIIDVNTRQDATDQAIINQALVIAGILNGTVPFSQLNVATNLLRSFLDKVTGGVLTDPTGLGTAVVGTGTLALQAVTNQVSAFTSAQLDLSGYATFFSTVQSVVITPTGGRIELKGNFYLRALVGAGSFTDTVIIERFDGTTLTTIFSMAMESPPITGADYIVGLQPVAFIDSSPPTGVAVTYALRIKSDASGWSQRYVSARFFSALEIKR